MVFILGSERCFDLYIIVSFDNVCIPFPCPCFGRLRALMKNDGAIC